MLSPFMSWNNSTYFNLLISHHISHSSIPSLRSPMEISSSLVAISAARADWGTSAPSAARCATSKCSCCHSSAAKVLFLPEFGKAARKTGETVARAGKTLEPVEKSREPAITYPSKIFERTRERSEHLKQLVTHDHLIPKHDQW